MHDKPHGAALLDVARRALLDGVAPILQGRARYTTLMVANAIGIASRELQHADRARRAWEAAVTSVTPGAGTSLDASVGRLAAGIRAGAYDAEPTLHAALLETAEVAATIWKAVPPGSSRSPNDRQVALDAQDGSTIEQ